MLHDIYGPQGLSTLDYGYPCNVGRTIRRLSERPHVPPRGPASRDASPFEATRLDEKAKKSRNQIISFGTQKLARTNRFDIAHKQRCSPASLS